MAYILLFPRKTAISVENSPLPDILRPRWKGFLGIGYRCRGSKN